MIKKFKENYNYILSGISFSDEIFIFNDPGITVSLLNLSGFLYSLNNLNSSSSVSLLLSCLKIPGKSDVVSNSLLYNL